MSFEPSQTVRTQIQFVTTEEFKLKSGTPPSFLLQDPDEDYLLKEDESRISLDQRI